MLKAACPAGAFEGVVLADDGGGADLCAVAELADAACSPRRSVRVRGVSRLPAENVPCRTAQSSGRRWMRMFLVKKIPQLLRRHPRQKVVIRFAVLHAELPRGCASLNSGGNQSVAVSCSIVRNALCLHSGKYASSAQRGAPPAGELSCCAASGAIRRFPLLKPRSLCRFLAVSPDALPDFQVRRFSSTQANSML